MKIKITLLLITAFFITSINIAQEVKFGKVSKEELEEQFYPQDSDANAAVLFKMRRTGYEYDGSTGWRLITKVHERLKLYNKDGFEYATTKVPIYSKGSKSESFSVKAYTYNLEGGKVEKSKLSKSDIFDEEITENWSSRNFTMPNLKEGSVIEWEYTITSPYFSNINDVICQYDIPIKYMEFNIEIPEYFVFKYFPSRYYPIKVNQSNNPRKISYSYRTKDQSIGGAKTSLNNESIELNEKIFSSVTKNIPALVEEPYVNNINNYRAKVKFEMTAYVPKYGSHEYFNTTWNAVTKTIYENNFFGDQLNKKGHFKDDLANIIEGITLPQERMQAIFQFVKTKIKWNEIYGKYTSTKGIKNAYNEGTGNVAEINLTLIAMLREAGLNANPVLVSTRSHGIQLFPTTDGFNYVIAGVETKDNVILLDATEKYSSPDVLPLRNLNWEGRLIREHGSSTKINLYPSKYNTKNVKLSTKLDQEGVISGMMITTYTNLNALQYRDKYISLAEDELISILEAKNNAIEIEKIRLNNKSDILKPLVEMVKFACDNQVDVIGDKIYISPLLFLSVHENPFKQEERLYPIDYGSAWKNEIKVAIEMPEGFTIESIPEDFSLLLPDNLGTHILKTEVVNNKINVTSQTKINNPIIGSNYYKTLKDLYKQVIDKQLEKIVLVKSEP
jgi:Domain of Unknown Function with PDB structure (DUF3857)/Transglutaminase-like superfamily